MPTLARPDTEKTNVKREVTIPLSEVTLSGNLVIPDGASSLVIFSHGSGSSRFSPRNNFVAGELNTEKIATLLTDLLSPEEDTVYETRFDIALLTKRLSSVTRWVQKSTDLKHMQIGYFGASTGAASALSAAAMLKTEIAALVSRGGRPDLAIPVLSQVTAPTLLIIGSLDDMVLELNEEAYSFLNCEKKLTIVEGATHLFGEAGKLEEVARLAVHWFKKYLAAN